MFIHARFASTLAIGAAIICSAAAQAADNTRYVSISGNNANACTLAAPCRTLQKGINATPAGGELRILDSGNYGNNANIGKSLTISGNGHTVILANPITINNAAAVVALRGLTLNGQGTIFQGISITAAATVHIERCVIHGFTGDGILATATATGVEVYVLDSISRDNGGGGLTFYLNAESSRLTVDNSRFENNRGTGVHIEHGRATIHRSTVSGNNNGIIAGSGTFVSVVSTVVVQNTFLGLGVAAGGIMMVESSVAHGNGTIGLYVTTRGATARISNSTFTANATGIRNNNGGTVETRQNNTVRGNTTNVSGPLTVIGGV
jgi:hypothetical protein